MLDNMVQPSSWQKIVSEFELIHYDDFSGIFRLVRAITRDLLQKTRPGILLGLVEMGFDRGNFIGGYHFGGTNEIYLNKSALRVMLSESSPELYKAYVFFLLLHEYIHAIGIHDESQTRRLTREVIITVFGKTHPISKLALEGLNAYFPYTFNQRTYKPSRFEQINKEFVKIHHPDSELTYQ